jgi:lipopolysaccharide/colanic/teichoic acid biosynthesis glycosyltransferase
MSDQGEPPEKELEIKDPFVSGGSRSADPAKRLADLMIAAALIVLTMPLMGLVALAIKCDSAGPVFDRHERVGLQGRLFFAVRFRITTYSGASDTRPTATTEPHTQFTRVGRFLRVTRWDCLPQLINVARGDMSVIGASEERPHFLD